MPEHRPGTPQVYATLKSFLWWDFRDAERLVRMGSKKVSCLKQQRRGAGL